MKHTLVAPIAGASLAIAVALAGCGSSPNNATDESESTNDVASPSELTLTFWGTYGNGGNSAQTDVLENELIPLFESENPGVKVNYIDMPYDGLKQKLTTSSAAGELPDLIRTDIGWNAQFAQMGVFKQLDGEMPGFEELAEKVYPGALETTSFSGHYYGLPLNTNTRVLISNSAALEAAGMTEPPATFDEVNSLGEALKGSGVQVFADSGLGAWNVMPWIWSAGGDIADPDLTVSTGYLDSDESVAGVQMLVDLYQAGLIPNLITGNEGATSTSDGLPSGNYATILDGPWMRDIWEGQYPDFDPTYSLVPAGPGGSISVVGGESIVITENTIDVDAAYKFLEFTQSKEFQLGMAKVGQMSVVPEFSAEQAELVPSYGIFSEQLETARARLPIPGAGEIDGILNNELVKAFDGEVSVKDALTEAASQIDPLLTVSK